jgi:hypothetical protein
MTSTALASIILEYASLIRKHAPDMTSEEINNRIVAQVRDILGGGLEWHPVDKPADGVIPEVIFMQVEGDMVLSTWSVGKINDNDVRYVKAGG